MNRREFLKIGGSGALSAGVITAGGGTGFGALSLSARAQNAARPLPIIPMTDLIDGIDTRFPLLLKTSTHDFGNGGVSKTFGINNDYLGPVIRVKQGQTLPFDVTNSIDDVSTLHWHGLHIPGEVDGGPHQEIKVGQTWSPDVPIVQHASMNWFHSHTHGKTSQQTYNGLAGVMLIEDDASLSADLPKSYGVDDFTLVLQDKTFNGAGEMSYELTGEVFEEGFLGDTMVVNGAIAPVAQTVPKGLVRLRILNACNARFLTLSMASGPVHVIASDGGFLSSTVPAENIVMSPGERYEILVDMGATDANSLQVEMGGGEGMLGFLGGLFGGGSASQVLLNLNQNTDQGFDGTMPDKLANMDVPDPSQATITRSFELNMGGGTDFNALALAWGNICGDGAMGINGQPMNMDRIDQKVRKGDTEIWRMTVDEDVHPFHIHGCSFRILSQQGATPPSYAQGWKDMVHVEGGWSEVLVKFDYEAPENAPYMYHCHILEHEDCGMMGQFTVG
ncbi:MAG: multicopper oxidase domain-containing protein [Lentilitoribacter sp.]